MVYVMADRDSLVQEVLGDTQSAPSTLLILPWPTGSCTLCSQLDGNENDPVLMQRGQLLGVPQGLAEKPTPKDGEGEPGRRT